MRLLALSVLLVLVTSCGTESPAPEADTESSGDIDGLLDSSTEGEPISLEDTLQEPGDTPLEPQELPGEGDVVALDDATEEDPQADILEPADDVLASDSALPGDVAGDAPEPGPEDAAEVSEPEPEPIALEGDTCAEAILVDPQALPFEYQGDTTHAQDDLALAGGCGTGGDIGAGAPDILFSFTPELSAHHVVGMNPATVIGASPAVIYVVETCEEASFSCVGVSSNLSAGGVMSVYLEAQVTYTIVVDGLLEGDSGGFTFMVEEAVCVLDCPGPECGKDGCGGFCGEGCSEEEACRPDGMCDAPLSIEGNSCDNPFLIESLPFATSRDTWYGTNEASFGAGVCPGEPHPIGAASNDHFYQLDIETTGLYSIAITTDYDAALYVATECTDINGTCIAGSDQSLGIESMELYLEAGQSLSVVVDGYGNEENLNGVYTLQISQACVAFCGDKNCGDDGCGGSCGECVYGEACSEGLCGAAPLGDTCLNPFIIESAPATLSGDTSAFYGEMGYGAGDCPGMSLGWGAGSKDVVYAFEPSVQDLYTLSLSASFDSTLYVVTDCSDVASSCIVADDQHPTEESVDLWMYPGTTYFIIVDGYGNQSNVEGSYTLDVTPACVPQCKLKECGSDGCGGICGECEGFSVCNDQGLCESQEGNSCDTPFLIDSLPFSVESDSSDATNLMGAPYDACPDETAVRGPVSAEEVWAYTPSLSGVYTASLSSSFPAALYTLTDCALFTTDCFVEENPGPLVWYDVIPGCGWSYYDQGQCVGMSTGFLPNGETIELKSHLEAGTTYYYVVDGNSLNFNENGAYTLELEGPCTPQCEGKSCGSDGCGLSCGECSDDLICDDEDQCVTQEGNSCETPFVVADDVSLPVSYQGSTSDATNTYGKPYGQCPGETKKIGAGSRDEVYAFTPQEDGNYEISITSQFQGALYILNDCSEFISSCFFKETLGHDSWTAVVPGCGFSGETCLGAYIEDPEEPSGLLEVELIAGQTVYIVVDGQGGLYDTSGTYTLTIDRACDPQCEGKSCGDDGCGDVCGECPGGFICDEEGACIDITQTPGNTCDTALPVGDMPFLAAGDTTDNSHVYQGDGCLGVSGNLAASGAKDEVWVITPEQSGLYIIDISGQAEFDPIVYVVSDCSDESWTCLKGTADVTMDVALEAGTTYYIVVDGGSDPEDPPLVTEGSYVLEVSLP